jgi:hypothetical protein
MSAIQGVLKDRLTPARTQPVKIKKKGECVVQLSTRDYETFVALDEAALQNKRIRFK